MKIANKLMVDSTT